jgi:hypothetical protein
MVYSLLIGTTATKETEMFGKSAKTVLTRDEAALALVIAAELARLGTVSLTHFGPDAQLLAERVNQAAVRQGNWIDIHVNIA